jgi:hypothetical protein
MIHRVFGPQAFAVIAIARQRSAFVVGRVTDVPQAKA